MMAEQTSDATGDAPKHLARGCSAHSHGDLSGAARELNAAFEGFLSMGDAVGVGRTLLQLALVALDRGDLDGAAASAGRGVQVLHGAGDSDALLCGLEVVARVAATSGDPGSAVRLLATAERHRAGSKRPPDCGAVAASALLDDCRAELGAEALDRERVAGLELSVDQAVALALARCGVAPA